MTDPNRLIGVRDCREWAAEFIQCVTNRPAIATDEGAMMSWFASAIETGVDIGRTITPENTVTMDRDLIRDLRDYLGAMSVNGRSMADLHVLLRRLPDPDGGFGD